MRGIGLIGTATKVIKPAQPLRIKELVDNGKSRVIERCD
jgi:hypothetical protein